MVLIPWTGWSLLVEDFLLTRMLEIVVHTDDLAASIGGEPAGLPEGATDPVLALLLAMAREQYGDQAVLRALARNERAPSSISVL